MGLVGEEYHEIVRCGRLVLSLNIPNGLGRLNTVNISIGKRDSFEMVLGL